MKVFKRLTSVLRMLGWEVPFIFWWLHACVGPVFTANNAQSCWLLLGTRKHKFVLQINRVILPHTRHLRFWVACIVIRNICLWLINNFTLAVSNNGSWVFLTFWISLLQHSPVLNHRFIINLHSIRTKRKQSLTVTKYRKTGPIEDHQENGRK